MRRKGLNFFLYIKLGQGNYYPMLKDIVRLRDVSSEGGEKDGQTIEVLGTEPGTSGMCPTTEPQPP